MPVEMRGRHGIRHVPQAPSVWKCPACGSENSGPLEQGCQSCGSGKPGQHVGVDPPARPEAEQQAPISSDALGDRWLEWIRPYRGKFDADAEQMMYAAFTAGYEAGLTVGTGLHVPLKGTAESRTIIAALRLFLEQIPEFGDEVARGEFLSAEQIQQLIQRLERTQ